jgi:DNA mismatch repair enzyme (predicted ATPase)
MERNITLPPDPARVMEGLRDTGYNFNTAAADIIDNSIAAKATKVDISINLDVAQNITVLFADNGCGMNEEELLNAMKYGSKERPNAASLGKFGLGLKTASTAFCRSLSVISRGDDNIMRKVQWDLDHIVEIGDWELLMPDVTEDECSILEDTCGDGTGTLVVWDKIDRLLQNSKTPARKSLKRIEEQLRFHISLVYQRFLDKSYEKAPNVEISLNGVQIKPWDPFCSAEPNATILGRNQIEIDSADDSVQGELFIKSVLLPRKEEFSSAAAAERALIQNSMQGFYIYRENRLIHYGDWMGMFINEPHGTLLRVELSFDHRLDKAFSIDIKKSRILLNEDIFDEIKNRILPAPRRAADERYRLGTQKKAAEVSKTAHDAANQNIEQKAPSVEKAKITVTDIEKGEVEIANKNGVTKSTLTIKSTGDQGKCRVIPVPDLEAGVLWHPALYEEKHAVEINTSHPYYQKVYLPVLSQSVMVTGMDALLWALSEAEFATYSDETKEAYEDLRILVSQTLKKLVKDLPEPNFDDNK